MGHSLDKDYWESRYAEQDTGWDAGAITTPLKNYIDGLTDKSLQILVPGAGNAHEVAYLHQQSFENVYVLDIARQPLDNFLEKHPDFPERNAIQADFFGYEPEKPFDLILEQTFFCALDTKLRPEYAKKMHALLRPGGVLAGLLFGVPMNADQPPFGGNKAEYTAYFNPYFEIKQMDWAKDSIKPRAGKELFFLLNRKP